MFVAGGPQSEETRMGTDMRGLGVPPRMRSNPYSSDNHNKRLNLIFMNTFVVVVIS